MSAILLMRYYIYGRILKSNKVSNFEGLINER